MNLGCLCKGTLEVWPYASVVCMDSRLQYNPTACKFTCIRCRRRVPWCRGADDALPEHCDDCWALEKGTDARRQKT